MITAIAQISRATSTVFPTAVSGFFIDEETVKICTVEKKIASPKPWTSLAFSPVLPVPDYERAEEIDDD